MNPNKFDIDYVSSPGDTIAESLESQGMTPRDLADRLGVTESTIYALISGYTLITPAIASGLELHLGGTKDFWLNMEILYRNFLQKRLYGSTNAILWTSAKIKPSGTSRKILCWVEYPPQGRPLPTEPVVGWWRHGPGCFALDSYENANHLVKYWAEINEPEN